MLCDTFVSFKIFSYIQM